MYQDRSAKTSASIRNSGLAFPSKFPSQNQVNSNQNTNSIYYEFSNVSPIQHGSNIYHSNPVITSPFGNGTFDRRGGGCRLADTYHPAVVHNTGNRNGLQVRSIGIYQNITGKRIKPEKTERT